LNLIPNTTYFLRAYATNENGTAYGLSFSFKTFGVIQLTTNEITEITGTTATSGGNITSDGGATIIERGVCWNTTENPTINDNKTSDGSGSGPFTSSIIELVPNSTYYARSYARSSSETAYGNTQEFITLTPKEEEQLDKLKKSWNIISAALNGSTRTSDFSGFKLIISGIFDPANPNGPYNYSVSGSRPTPSPWPSSGQWSFAAIGTGDSGTLLRSDDVPITYSINSNGHLTVTFECQDCDYAGSRTKEVNGTWVFVFD
jgi:hypothetical protein